MTTISDHIRQLRIAAGLTQDELAKKLDIDSTVVSRWENGQTPRARTLVRLAKLFDVSLESFLTDTGEE